MSEESKDKLEREMPEVSRFIDDKIEEWNRSERTPPKNRATALRRLKSHCREALRLRMELLDKFIRQIDRDILQQYERYGHMSKQMSNQEHRRTELIEEKEGFAYLKDNLGHVFSKFEDDIFNRIKRSTVEKSET